MCGFEIRVGKRHQRSTRQALLGQRSPVVAGSCHRQLPREALGYEASVFSCGKAPGFSALKSQRAKLDDTQPLPLKGEGYDLTAAGDLAQFPDSGSVADWAETAMSWANGNELINGHDDCTIDAGGAGTRAQAASILMNFDQNLVEN